jgi:3-mercaptopyruvate sulfurtransferase SseA
LHDQLTEASMALHHSEETHRQLVERIPSATGREMKEWFGHLDEGPGMLRFDERVSWLRSEYGLAHGHATAIVHEHNLQKAQRAFQ